MDSSPFKSPMNLTMTQPVVAVITQVIAAARCRLSAAINKASAPPNSCAISDIADAEPAFSVEPDLYMPAMPPLQLINKLKHWWHGRRRKGQIP
ncbi:hypothetical protein CWE09_07540 [Aliidiomarina minuta]|uniref:Uncharacterized protein n=1 Tax=Aliidiomarina minuta TaxID=880057 RepID=A0A432W8Y9_9GAMM|nr:hypothetical protein CWE09_07540 [Aliidiomarina minuta]